MSNKEIILEPLKMDLTQYDCTEHGIYTVLKFYSLDYVKLYSDSLNLVYNIDALIHCGQEAFRFVEKRHNARDLCYKIFNVKFLSEKVGNIEQYVKKNIFDETIMLAYVDVFWDKNAVEYYGKIHSAGHSRIISGFCNDMVVYYEWDKKYNMKFELLDRSIGEICYLDRSNIYAKGYNELLDLVFYNFRDSNYSNRNNKMLTALQQVLSAQEIKKYLLGFAKVGNSPFFNSIRLLARSRRCMRIFLQSFLTEKSYCIDNNFSWIKSLCHILKELEEKWNIVINLLLKLHFLAERNEERRFQCNWEEVMEQIIQKEEIAFQLIESNVVCSVK